MLNLYFCSIYWSRKSDLFLWILRVVSLLTAWMMKNNMVGNWVGYIRYDCLISSLYNLCVNQIWLSNICILGPIYSGVVAVVWQLDLQLPMQSVPITTNVLSSNLLRRGVLDTTLCDKVCQLLATGQWFSQGTLVASINKTDRHDITEILLRVALNTKTLNPLSMPSLIIQTITWNLYPWPLWNQFVSFE